MDVSQLILRGESQNVEFKRAISSTRKAMESLCAMANANSGHGTVIFGVADDGTVCGIEPGNTDSAQRKLAQAITQSFDPSLAAEFQLTEIDGKRVLAMTAERQRSVPYHEYDGRAWIREGTRNRKLVVHSI